MTETNITLKSTKGRKLAILLWPVSSIIHGSYFEPDGGDENEPSGRNRRKRPTFPQSRPVINVAVLRLLIGI